MTPQRQHGKCGRTRIQSAIDTVAVLTQPEVDQVLPVVRFRAECLNAHWFLTLADAREKLEACCKYYNEERPHGAIGNK